jgi:CHAD domain-containing protein
MREIIKITRALGVARDADVQIAFLMKLQKKIDTGTASESAKDQSRVSRESAAIGFLLGGLRKKRAHLQKRILASLAELEKSGVTDSLQQVFLTRLAEFRSVHKQPSLQGIPPLAAYRISRRLSTLLSYDPWVQQPEAVAEHHAMRIAAKKLRYTMEIYGALYRNGLKKPLAHVKRIQEILGEIHDCDVWIDHVTQILLHERTLLRSSRRADRPDTKTLASLRIFLQKREAERMQRYHRFVLFWKSLSRTGLWPDLIKTMDTGRRKQVLPILPYSDEETMAAINTLADLVPEVAPHSRHVTMLAFMLFDSLQSLHGLAPRDRFLLESAGLLHDIGWYGGKARHSNRGALMVFTDQTLRFDIQEKGIISTVIASHRGRVDPVSLPYYSLLSSENQKRALKLAALLRLADGLDFLHTGSVREVHCTRVADKVFIEINGIGDLAAEKEHARIKGDFFTRVFHSRPVIR